MSRISLSRFGALLDARALDRVGHAADRAERRIELQTADRAARTLRTWRAGWPDGSRGRAPP